jgi:tRNA modification GTPase
LLKELEDKVRNLACQNGSAPITRARYRHSLETIVENLLEFSLHKNIEFAAEDLRLAIREIGKITGKVEVDDILDIIFSGFCIGK